MGILERIKKAFTPEPLPTLDDVQFGRIFQCDPDLWQDAPCRENQLVFAPTGDKIGITISGDEKGPSSNARDLYSELQQRYGELIASMEPFLRHDSSIAMLSDTLVSDQDVMNSFKLCSLSIIVASQEAKPKIVLTYAADWRPELFIDVTVRDWVAVDAEGYD